jgi:hypothetical protein
VHRLHGRSGYGLLNVYRSMVEFLIVHLLIIEILLMILKSFLFVSIHPFTHPTCPCRQASFPAMRFFTVAGGW